MKMYITAPVGGAGVFIWEGYRNAWGKAGFDVEYIRSIPTDTPDEYDAMITEVSLYNGVSLDLISSFFSKARRA